MFFPVLCLFFGCFLSVLTRSFAYIPRVKFVDLPYDSNGRLEGNWIMIKEDFGEEALCREEVFRNETNWLHREEVEDMFQYAFLTEEDYVEVLKNDVESNDEEEEGNEQLLPDIACFAVRLIPGSPKELVHYPLPANMFKSVEGSLDDDDKLSDWFYSFHATETGWISYMHNPLSIVWVDQTSTPTNRVPVAKLNYGDSNTVWLNTRLGHHFEIEDTTTGEVVFSNKVLYDSYHTVGEIVFPELPSQQEVEEEFTELIHDTLHDELERSRRVVRTFTETGFDVGDLPKDLFASMLTYYYNSYNNTYVEEWPGMVHVNWWETPSLLVSPPWILKRYWQSRLLPMVEAWIGGNISLETSDIYGIRRYLDGARLLTHVDREETHAVSLIINLEQVAMQEPWYIEVYDLNNYLHKVEMRPGQVVYYESARCLHGRMAPLKGASYSNIFSHYRPIGDPAWFRKENPVGTIEPLPDFDSVCSTADSTDSSLCSGGAADFVKDYPHLVPDEPPIRHADDLFKYWKKVGSSP